MANFVYSRAKAKLMSGDLDLNADDIRALLVMTNTTADTEEDSEFVSSITTLDEMDGTGYSRQTLTGEAVAVDTANNRGEFTANDIKFMNVSAGTRNVAAVMLIKHVTNDTDSIPIAYIDTDSTSYLAYTPNGGTITVTAASGRGLIEGQ